MVKIFNVAVAFIVLSTAGANAGEAFWKPNLSQNQMIEDQVDCNLKGLKEAPPDRHSSGYDRNFELRHHVIARCMKSKKYQAVNLRGCGPFKKKPDLSKPIKITKKTCTIGIAKAYIFAN